MEKGLVTVLLPVFNSEKYIAEAIDSILNQTYANFELIILDDGSTDESLSVVHAFSDPRILVHTESINKGIVYQLNKGISLAKGEFIARMDADDISLPDRFDIQLKYFNKYPKLDVLGGQALKFGIDKGLMNFAKSSKCVDYLLNYYCSVLHPTVMMRSSLFNARDFKYKNNNFAEDYQLWCELSDGQNISNTDEVLIKYRIHNSQTNKRKFDEQYLGALDARKIKLKKTFRFSSEQFIEKFNTLSNDYLFHGALFNYTSLKKNYRLFDMFMYYIFYFNGFTCRKSIVSFVRNNLFRN